MQTQRLIKAIEKAGIKVERVDNVILARGEKYLVEFCDQDGDAVCVNVRRHNDESDSMTDYHAGFFCRTIKSVVDHLSRGGQ